MRFSRFAAATLLLASTFACQGSESSLLVPGQTTKPRVQRIGHSKPLLSRQGPAGVSFDVTAPTGGIAVQDMTQGVTAQQLAQSLVGPGVTISNVTYTGATGAAGIFSADSSVLGVKNGIILSTGSAAGVVGPNVLDDMTTDWGGAGDADLSALVGNNETFDASVLQFDFVPDSSTIYISQYVFGSEEYDVFVGSDFNDAMAFYVNGTNCALVGGQPVSINAINDGYPYGTPPASNPDLYRDNTDATGKTINTELNGVTRVLQCAAPVNKGVTNHLKLAIADTYDGLYDSDVFIGGGSLTTVPPNPIPVPHAVATYTVGAPACNGTFVNVNFDGTGSYESIGAATSKSPIVKWEWMLYATGNQVIGTGSTVTLQMFASMTATLRVTDSLNQTSSTTFNVNVPAPPTSTYSFSVTPTSIQPNAGAYVPITVSAAANGACAGTPSVAVTSSQVDQGSAAGDQTGDIKIVHADGSVTTSSNTQPTVTFNPATDHLYLRAETLDSVTNRTYTLVMSAAGAQHGTATVVVPHPIPTTNAPWAIFANSTLRFTGNAGTDGYNSGVRAYSQSHHDSTGNVAAIGPITFTGNSQVQGDAVSASSITPGARYVTGTEVANSKALTAMAVVACPAGNYSPASSVSGNKYSYNAKTGELSVSGNGSIVLTGAGPYYFSSISLAGNATLQTTNPGGAHVDVYVSDDFDDSGNGVTNAKSMPGALAIISCGSPKNAATWSITGNGASYMSVYAPNHDIHIAGNGDLYGCLVGNNIDINGNAKVHVDEALGGACGTGSAAGGNGGGNGAGGSNGNGNGNGSNCNNGKGNNGDDNHAGGDDGKGSGGDQGGKGNGGDDHHGGGDDGNGGHHDGNGHGGGDSGWHGGDHH